MSHKILSIDIETYSDEELKDVGVYKYVNSSSFEILLLAYSYNDEPVEIIDLAQGEEIPKKLIEDICSNDVIKHAYNAQFERVCLSKHFKKLLDPKSWHCTQVLASYLALPSSLSEVAEVLNIEQQKMKSGYWDIKYFCKPCKPSKANGERTRNYPHHDLEAWENFKAYCKQDVRTEQNIYNFLKRYQVPNKEWELYCIDQRMNDKGVAVDIQMVDNILNYFEDYKKRLEIRAVELSGLENPKSVTQLIKWLHSKNVKVPNLTKETVAELFRNKDKLPEDVVEVLQIRQMLSIASIGKYNAFKRATCSDNRIRGVLQFYGANRTGRWAGRIIQPQNMTKNTDKTIDEMRKCVQNNDFETLEVFYNNISDVFNQLIRTVIIPKKGYTFAISDYSSIEARVIAWLSDEKWQLEVFRKNEDIYKQTASNMFKIPIDKIDKPLRQRGKVAVLALGYQGGTNALIKMGALKQGIQEEELQGLVDAWRRANPNITKLWRNVQRATLDVIQFKKPKVTINNITFRRDNLFLFIDLPSGRSLAYFKPHIVDTQIRYYGKNEKYKYAVLETHGGKLVENIVQALARDCLAEALLKYHDDVVLHVHDEIIAEVKKDDTNALKKLQDIMAEPIEWAQGLHLSSAGFITDYYVKD